MAICDFCKQEMLTSDGCIWTHAKKIKGKKLYKRDTSNLCDQERCHDCRAKLGKPHHPGCDNERCPICGHQAIMCDCKYYLVKRRES